MTNNTTTSLAIGTILHGEAYDYKIMDVLGQGTFGITYKAKVEMKGALGRLDSNMYVAVKEFFMKEVNGRENSSVTSGSTSNGACSTTTATSLNAKHATSARSHIPTLSKC